MVESLQIAIVASALGTLLSLPLALVAARNLIAGVGKLAGARGDGGVAAPSIR